MKKFIKKIQHLKAAGYPAIFIQTHEEKRLEEILSSTFPNNKIFVWDIITGMSKIEDESLTEINHSIDNPIDAILFSTNTQEHSIVILKDMHRFTESIEVTRALKTAIEENKKKAITLIMPVPLINIPTEIEKECVVIDMPLPDEKRILKVAEQIIKDNALNIKVKTEEVSTGKGLTLNEAENAIALSIIETGKISKKVIEKQKLQAIKKSGILEIYNPVNPDEIGGLDNLKNYLKNRKKGFENPNLPNPRGIILTGIPGTGKSLSAKAAASIFEMPLIKLDFSALKSSLVGESEKLLRNALKLIDAISPVVVWIDEIEKALGGVSSSNYTDGGTTSAMFGNLLTWMQESKIPKYIIATANDIDDLLKISQGALIRRFDDIFFVDLPTLDERKEILKIMNKKYSTSIPLEIAVEMENWTGAEIEKFVISSIYDGIEEALKSIKPIYQQNREYIEKARQWGISNARMASNNQKITQQNSKIRKLNI